MCYVSKEGKCSPDLEVDHQVDTLTGDGPAWCSRTPLFLVLRLSPPAQSNPPLLSVFISDHCATSSEHLCAGRCQKYSYRPHRMGAHLSESVASARMNITVLTLRPSTGPDRWGRSLRLQPHSQVGAVTLPLASTKHKTVEVIIQTYRHHTTIRGVMSAVRS